MKGEVAHHQKVESEGEYFMLHIITSASFWGEVEGNVTQLVGSYFPNQELNPDPWQWKHRVLTTGPQVAAFAPLEKLEVYFLVELCKGSSHILLL